MNFKKMLTDHMRSMKMCVIAHHDGIQTLNATAQTIPLGRPVFSSSV